jgi:DNA-binding transcriptional ArsR family regulator
MVQQRVLDRTFSALADATRRDILTRLGDGPATISELADAADMTLTGIRKHVDVLAGAGLVGTEKVGRTRQVRLGTERLDDAMAWISFYQRLWERRLDGLEAYFTLRNGVAAAGGAPRPTTDRPDPEPQGSDRHDEDAS